MDQASRPPPRPFGATPAKPAPLNAGLDNIGLVNAGPLKSGLLRPILARPGLAKFNAGVPGPLKPQGVKPNPATPNPGAARPGLLQRRAAPAGRSPPLQQRLYPNLRPLALPELRADVIYTLHGWNGHYGLRGVGGRGHLVPNARYLFVRTRDGQTRVHARLRHPVLSGGEPVLYAGEMYFEAGALRWWSNGSGHFRPDPEHAPQADLPMALFRTWDDVIRRGTRTASPGAG